MNCYFGIDIGSISTKAVVLDEDYNILEWHYIETEGNPIEATKRILEEISIPEGYILRGIGTTGSARKLIAIMLGASVEKNEITAHALGTLAYNPDTRTILEIGGQDSKVILIRNGLVRDYAMNTLCAAGTGAFLSGQAKRLGIDIETFSEMSRQSNTPVSIAARCSVFAESDLVHKAQIGYKKEDIIAGLCKSIVINYLNNVCKGKKLEEPIVFQGGVAKNAGVVRYFEEILGKKITTNPNGHLMGAIGAAISASKLKGDDTYSLNIRDMDFKTIGSECTKCANRCELIKIIKNSQLIDIWGSKCGNY